MTVLQVPEIFTIYFDASVRREASLIGYWIEGSPVAEGGVYQVRTSSCSEAEALALLAGLCRAQAMGLERVYAIGDSEFAVRLLNQVRGGGKVPKGISVDPAKIRRIVCGFEKLDAWQVGRDANWLVHNMVEEVYQEMLYDNDKAPSLWRIDDFYPAK